MGAGPDGDYTEGAAEHNGAISVAELYRGLKSEVVRDTAGRQTPWLSRNLMVGDFDIF